MALLAIDDGAPVAALVLEKVEPGRLRRGADRAVKKIGAAQYVVQGTREPWIVDLESDVPCTCPDAQYRTTVGPCLHLWAALLQQRVPAAVQALAMLHEQRLRADRAPAAGEG
jgi:hypothetical protein